MTVIAAYLYREGKRQAPVTLTEPAVEELTETDFVWIGLLISRKYSLHLDV